MFRTSQAFEQGKMRRFFSTADMPVAFDPATLGDLLFYFAGVNANASTWVDETNTYTLDTSTVTITDGYAAFTGSERLEIGVLPNPDEWSIVSLVKPNQNTAKACIMSNDVANYNNDVIFGIANPTFYGFTYHSVSPSSITDLSAPVSAALVWATVALVSEGTTAKLYINGVLAGSITKSFNFTYGNLITTTYMGGSGQSKYWNGNIKDLLFYQSPLSIADIQSLHTYLIQDVS